MNRLHALIVCSFLVLSSTVSYSQTFQNVPLFIRANADNIGLDEGDEIFRVRNAWLNRIKNGTYDNIQIQIPSNEGSYTLLASKRQIAPDDGIKVTTESGQYFQEDGGQHYFGTIAGAQNSTVIISSIGDHLHILVQDTNRKIRVIKNHPGISGRYLSRETSEFDNIINCGSSDDSKGLKNGSPSLNRGTGNCNVVCDSPCSGTTDVHVYYEFDFISFLDENSSINDCITFMTMTHAVINHIYSNIDQVANNQHNGHPNLSSDINMIFSGFHIWDSPDPYPIEIFARRTAFQTVRPTFDGDVAHLINKGTINAGGIASIDLDNTSASLCDNGNPPAGGFTPHSLSFLTAAPVNFANTFSFGTALIAHEIGHTLGGRHPNECKWYDNNDFAIHRDMGTCEIFPTPACNHPTCTITTGYNPTIMSRCWFTNSPANTIDYSNPFHREIAINILDNLCNINLCYVPCNSDNDLDGFCTNDPNECDDNNPTIPGVVGQPCSDGNSQTVDDMFVVDSSTPDPNLSCICEGTPWSNPVGTDACNLIIGGPLDFEDDMVGAAHGTWYGGLQTGWTTSPGNTPDIGHGLVAGNCEQFIGLAGSWNSNATPQRVGIKEGLAIELSTPIPCNVGQFHLSFDYGLINTNGNQPFTNDLINVQGTETLIMMMPHDCPHPGVECLTTLGDPSLVTAHNNFNSVFSNNCTVNLDFATQPASTVINNANFDLNFIYLSFDVDANIPDGVHEVLLDNIAINILPQSYGNPSSFTNECIIETIDHSIYCDIDLQRFNGSDWESISFNTISTSEYVDSGFKMVSRVIDFEVLDCADYRIVQTCTPGGVNQSCDTRAIDVDLRNCDNNIDVNLLQTATSTCVGSSVTVWDPSFFGQNVQANWSNGDMTSIVQNQFTESVAGIYQYGVTVTDETGCTGTDNVTITYEQCDPGTPVLTTCNNLEIQLDVSNIDCSGFTNFEWQTMNSNNMWEFSTTDMSYSPTENGEYRYCMTHPLCGTVCTESINVDCLSGTPQGFTCPDTHPQLETYFIDATLSAMDNISMWLDPVTVPPGFQSIPFTSIPIGLGGTINQVNNIRIVVRGDLIMDDVMIFQDCLFDFERNAAITTDAGILTFNNSTLKTCDPVNNWKGITASGGDWLGISNNSFISDADNAVTMNTGSVITISNTTFQNNVVGLYSPEDQGALAFQGFSGNHFIGGAKSTHGISLRTIPSFDYHSDGEKSTFIGLNRRSIEARNSSISFRNVDVDGLSSTWSGFHLSGMNEVKLSGIKSERTTSDGIRITSSPGASITMNDIEINNNQGGSFGWGIFLSSLDGATLTVDDYRATNNRLSSVDINGSNFSQATFNVVRISNTVSSGNGFNIDNSNNIEIFGGFIDGTRFRTIEMRSSNNIVVQGLEMTGSSPSSWTNTCTVGDNISWRDNTINDGRFGVYMVDITNPFICGNDLLSNDIGINLQNSSFNPELNYVDNTHDGNEFGLRIEDSAIGPNDQAGNTFLNGSGASARKSSNPPLPAIALNSPFRINYDDDAALDPTGTSLNPWHANVNINEWFPNDPFNHAMIVDCANDDPFNECECITGEELCCEKDPCCALGIAECCPDPVLPDCEELLALINSVINGNPPAGISPAQRLNLHLGILGRHFSRDPLWDLIPEIYKDCYEELDELVGEYALSEDAQDLTALYLLEQEYKEATKLNQIEKSSLAQLRSESAIIKQSIAQLDHQKKEELAEIITLNEDLAELDDAFYTLTNSFRERKKQRANNIISEARLLSTDNATLSYRNMMLEIQAYLLVNPQESLPTYYLSSLIEIAYRCPYEHGRPVYQARLIFESLGGPSALEYPDTCDELELREAQNNESSQLVNLYPNPSNGNITITTKEDLLNSKIQILDITGRSVILHENIDLTNGEAHHFKILENGIFFMNIVNENYSQQIRFIVLDGDN